VAGVALASQKGSVAAEAAIESPGSLPGTAWSLRRSVPPLYRHYERPPVPEPVETTDPEGVDYGRVMQLTFVYTIVVGAPLVALASIPADLPTWNDRAAFAIRVGALVWFLTSIAVYVMERRRAAKS
jgi:hypothetical protein